MNHWIDNLDAHMSVIVMMCLLVLGIWMASSKSAETATSHPDDRRLVSIRILKRYCDEC